MLLIAKKPQYLSPSSLFLAEGSPNKFYAERMSPEPIEREPQSLAAAAGSSFDAHIKDYLATQNGWIGKVKERLVKMEPDLAQFETLFNMLYHSSVERQNWPLVKTIGYDLCSMYRRTDIFKQTRFTDIEMSMFYTILDGQVPLFMKPDAAITINGINCPLDWKIQGYESDQSPKPGYKNIFDPSKGKDLGPHETWRKNISMDVIDERWAAQLCTYGWGMGHPIGAPFTGVIHALVQRSGNWRVVEYEGVLTKTFQLSLVRRYNYIWGSLKSNAFVRRLVQEPILQSWLASQEKWWM